MRLPFVLRKTYEAELNKSINIITEKNRIIAIDKDEIKAQRKMVKRRTSIYCSNETCYTVVQYSYGTWQNSGLMYANVL